LIESSSPLTNLGDEAILSSNVQIFKNSLSDCKIIVLSPLPEETGKAHNVFSKPNFMALVGKWSKIRGRLKVIWLGLRLLWNAKRLKNGKRLKLLNRNEAEFLRAFLDCDVFFIVGGSNFNDISPWGGLFSRGIQITLAKILGKPVFLGAQTVGPLRKKWTKMFTRIILEKPDLITLRDSNSYFLLRKIGVKNPRIKVVSDDAFDIKPIDQEKAIELLLKEKIDIRKLNEIGIITVGFNARPWWKRRVRAWKRKRSEKIKNVLLKIVDFFMRDKRFYLVFVPTSYREYSRGFDDAEGARELIQRLKLSEDKVKVLENKYNWQEIRAILGLFDLVLAVSYHSAVFAMSMGTPTIGLYQDEYYRMKLQGLFKMMNVEEFAIDITKTTIKEIVPKINQLLECRDEMREELSRETNQIKSNTCFAAKQLIHYLNTKTPVS